MSVNLFGSSAYPSLTVEFGFSSALSGFGAWDIGTWDSALWGPDVAWVDVSAYVRGLSTSWQRSRQLDRQPSATLSVELQNTDGRFTPANLSGPYVVAGVTQVRPRVPVRVTSTYGGVDFPIFYGRVNTWQDEFPSFGLNAVTRVTAADELATLGSIDLATVASVGAGDTAAARLLRILNAAGWSGPVAFDTGVATMQATTLGSNALSLCQLTADSDGGLFFADKDGTLTFYGRNSRTTRARSTTRQATFGGSGVPFRNAVVAYDDDTLVNLGRWSRVGGSVQTAQDTTSQALYGVLSSERSDLICSTDADVLDIVRRLVVASEAPEYRLASIQATCASAPAYWPTLLGLGIRDLVRATWSTPFATLTQDAYVSGISHSISADSGWWVTLGFESASRYLGSALWDFGAWDTDTWWA